MDARRTASRHARQIASARVGDMVSLAQNAGCQSPPFHDDGSRHEQAKSVQQGHDLR